MKKVFYLLLLQFFVTHLVAQEEGEPVISTPKIEINTNSVYGRITEGNSKKGMEGASVQLYVANSKNGNDSMIGGLFTRPNGDFRFSNLPHADSFKVVITAVGYSTEERHLSLGNGQKDLGNISLAQDPKTLAAVVVTAERPTLQMGIDRRVFNVDRNITSTGGTAIDVMRNIPSVTVDVEGNIQLRNASPQIFVDGRPTILTMDQIPAESIERIEIITNPSARFDAASTGGILNVVLKKNKKIGFNGIASIGAGHPGILNGNLNLNARQGKFNFFVSGNYNQSGGKAKGRTLRQNKDHGIVESYFNQYATNDRIRKFGSVRFGLDFFLDNRNTISVTQGLVNGKFSNFQLQDQQYLDANRTLQRYGYRNSDGNSKFSRYNTQLSYEHKFPNPDQVFSASINYNYGNGINNTSILNSFFFPDGTAFDNPSRVRNFGSNDNDQVTLQADYVHPMGEKSKLETGVRSFNNTYHNLFEAFAVTNGGETKLPLSTNIRYKEMVNAFYVTYSRELRFISYQAGVRAEYSKFDGELVDSARKFGYEYPTGIKQVFDALFPSLFLTKKFGDNVEMQLNYSRRIRRPNFWQLNPFIDINDPVNISQGNPQLRPEFTNSFEYNYHQQYAKGSFLGSVYYKNNQGDITRYSDTITTEQYQKLNQAAVDANAILNTFINAQATNRVGTEFTLQHKFSSAFEITPSINFEYRKVRAKIHDLNLSNEGFNWDSKLIMNYRFATGHPSLLNNLSFQVMGEYESGEVTPQGRQLEQYSVDFGMRKEFLKNKKATVSFSLNDVFNTNRWASVYDTENFYQESYNRRNVRSFRISFSYRFGSSDFKLFEGKNSRDDQDD